MIFADLHVHGPYSRGTSKNSTLDKFEAYAKMKGLSLLGTGDFTHPKWKEEISKLSYNEDKQLFFSETGFPFMLTTELSHIYRDETGKVRKIHQVVLAPSLEVVTQIQDALRNYGNLDVDGRPTLNLPLPESIDVLKGISKEVEVFPAHAWTPWFGVFGSKSGFDSLKEAYQDRVKDVHALETGLSSDPPMNWRLSELDRINLVSFSDAHSFWPWRIGRESTIFDCDLSYNAIVNAIRTGKGLAGTVEVDPSYGKYHWDGHRNCGVFIKPSEAERLGNVCPVCRKPLTLGVLHRVEELADRPEGYKPKDAKGFYELLPLAVLIANYYSTEPSTKKVQGVYDKLLELGNEFHVLLEVKREDLESKLNDKKLVDLILANRGGKLKVQPGYDGVYGKLILDGDVKESSGFQARLGDW